MARDYQPNRRGFGRMLASREMGEMVENVAEDYVPAVRAATPRASGETARSTHVESARGPDGRAQAKIVQEGAAVPLEWGNRRTDAVHHLSQVFGNPS